MWKTCKAVIMRNQISDWRAHPWTFTFGHIINGFYVVLVAYLAYHFLIRGELDGRFAEYAGTADYVTYAVIGGLLSTMSVSMMMNVSRSLITEWREGTLEVVLLSPGGRGGYLLGTAIQQYYRIGMELIPVFIASLFLGLGFPNADWFSFLAAFFLFSLACFSMALIMGSIMLATRDTYLIQNTLFSVTALVCGFLYPTQYLPDILRWFGELFPLTQALFLVRDSLISGNPIWQYPEKIGWVVTLTVLYSWVGFLLIHRAERNVFESKMV